MEAIGHVTLPASCLARCDPLPSQSCARTGLTALSRTRSSFLTLLQVKKRKRGEKNGINLAEAQQDFLVPKASDWIARREPRDQHTAVAAGSRHVRLRLRRRSRPELRRPPFPRLLRPSARRSATQKDAWNFIIETFTLFIDAEKRP